ncbi:MAG TPA: flagellar motor switch protein FliG, partial [Marisediminicola sp.]|nr:flagellar motor switch protein FliG [Marisediminicola sp.]
MTALRPSETDPSALTGTQKVAVVLMSMDQERAANVLKRFTEAEAQEIAAEIVRLKRVDSIVVERALTEFHDMAVHHRTQSRGGRAFAVGLLEASFGVERAAGVMNRVASSLGGMAFEFLDAAEPAQIVTLLDGELPQTIALVLAHLRPEQASTVIAGFVEPLRTDVARSIATMSSATPESVGIVAGALKLRAGAVVSARESIEVVGGVQPLVDIINRADISTERALLESLDLRDPELAEEVRSRMLTFADIVRLEDRDVQQVLRGIDVAGLAIALKGSPPAVGEKIRMNLSERNREILDEEIASAGPVRMSQVEDSRAEIVRT